VTETKRFKCSNCGEENPRKLHEEPDKTQVLYYSMQGAPVYKKRIKCGNCGLVFDKAE
jgi:rubredoxin